MNLWRGKANIFLIPPELQSVEGITLNCEHPERKNFSRWLPGYLSKFGFEEEIIGSGEKEIDLRRFFIDQFANPLILAYFCCDAQIANVFYRISPYGYIYLVG
jgi:hypothetical protein